MCNKINLPDRVEKARSAARFARVTSRDQQGRPTVVSVPGSEMKQYVVIIRRNGRLSVELNIDTGYGFIKPEFASKHITYHAMAAMMVCAEEIDAKISWCSHSSDAKNLSKIGGRVFRVFNFDNNDIVEYGVINYGD